MATAIAETAGGRDLDPATGQRGLPGPQEGTVEGSGQLPAAGERQENLSALGKVREILQQPAVRRAVPAIVAMFVVLLFVVLYSWSEAPSYKTLFPGMSDVDRQSAFEALSGAGFDVRIAPASGQLEVLDASFHEARLALAGRGLPASAALGGFDALGDQSSLTSSQFMEQVRYNVAVERELAMTISEIAAVSSVRVHLATARQSPFVRDRTPPKASVTVTPHPGRLLSEGQVRAIVHLVSASVPYLDASNVAVVDHLGNLLTDTAEQTAFGMSGTQLKLRRTIEQDLRSRVLQILGPIVGSENVRAEIDVTMDFTAVETTFERFDEDGQGPLTRSEVLAEERSARLDALGVPGATANEPPPDPELLDDVNATPAERGREGMFSSRSTRNYELDRSVQHVRNPVGTVTRLSLAVVLNDRGGALTGETAESAEPRFSPEQLAQFRDLVRGAVGADETRGDQVTLVAASFEPLPPVSPLLGWWEAPAFVGLAKSLGAMLLFALILFTIIRPVVRSFLGESPSEAKTVAALALDAGGELTEEELSLIEIGEGESIEDIKARLKPKKSSISADMLDTANTYDDKVALIRMICSEDAGRVANVMKNMIRVV